MYKFVSFKINRKLLRTSIFFLFHIIFLVNAPFKIVMMNANWILFHEFDPFYTAIKDKLFIKVEKCQRFSKWLMSQSCNLVCLSNFFCRVSNNKYYTYNRYQYICGIALNIVKPDRKVYSLSLECQLWQQSATKYNLNFYFFSVI